LRSGRLRLSFSGDRFPGAAQERAEKRLLLPPTEPGTRGPRATAPVIPQIKLCLFNQHNQCQIPASPKWTQLLPQLPVSILKQTRG
jgi:hypothetical protein